MKRFTVLLAVAVLVVTAAYGRAPQKGYRGFVESESFIFPNLGFLLATRELGFLTASVPYMATSSIRICLSVLV